MKRLTTVFLVTALAACESPFGPPTLVDRLRILDLRAEPPEIDLQSEKIVFTSLIGNPGAEEISCRWAVCLLNIGWVAGQIDCPSDDSLIFGTDCQGAELALSDLIAWYLEHGGQIPDELPPELEETDIPLFAGLEITAPGKVRRAIKRLRLNLEGDEPNTNPRLAGLVLEDGSPLPHPWQVKLGATIALRPLVDESSLQTFTDKDGNQRREDLLFSWFATAGSFSDRRTIWGQDSQGRRLENNRWFVDPAYSHPGPARLWLVGRDGRWGCDWLEFQVEILEK